MMTRDVMAEGGIAEKSFSSHETHDWKNFICGHARQNTVHCEMLNFLSASSIFFLLS